MLNSQKLAQMFTIPFPSEPYLWDYKLELHAANHRSVLFFYYFFFMVFVFISIAFRIYFTMSMIFVIFTSSFFLCRSILTSSSISIFFLLYAYECIFLFVCFQATKIIWQLNILFVTHTKCNLIIYKIWNVCSCVLKRAKNELFQRKVVEMDPSFTRSVNCSANIETKKVLKKKKYWKKN